jgi:cytochrome c553
MTPTRIGARWRQRAVGAALIGGAMAIALPASAQAPRTADAERGARLFSNTRGETGQPVGNCVACHANQQALAEMIRNRGARSDDPRALRALLQRSIDGAQPGALGAKAQYRGVLGERDLSDLAAYLARARRG